MLVLLALEAEAPLARAREMEGLFCVAKLPMMSRSKLSARISLETFAAAGRSWRAGEGRGGPLTHERRHKVWALNLARWA